MNSLSHNKALIDMGNVTTRSKYDVYNECSEILKKHGWKPETFFFSIGEGEDEDDDTIFIKGNSYVHWEYVSNRWYKGSYSKLCYVKGFDPCEMPIDLMNLICNQS